MVKGVSPKLLLCVGGVVFEEWCLSQAKPEKGAESFRIDVTPHAVQGRTSQCSLISPSPPLMAPTLSCCRLKISPENQIPHIASLILADSSSVLRPLMRRRYANVLDRSKHWQQEGLQLVVTANMLVKNRKRVVRSWSRRRVEQAIDGELRGRGFDKGGRWIGMGRAISKDAQQGGKGSIQASKAPKLAGLSGLRGYVNVQLLDGILTMKGTELQQQAGIVVDAILRQCRVDNVEAHSGRLFRP